MLIVPGHAWPNYTLQFYIKSYLLYYQEIREFLKKLLSTHEIKVFYFVLQNS